MTVTKIRSDAFRKRKRKEALTLTLFLTLPLAVLVVFVIYPVLSMFLYSFTDWNGFNTKSLTFIGLDNYIKIFTDSKYWIVFKNAVYYLISSLAQQVLALFFASLLSNKTRFGNFYKGSLFFPFLMNTVAVTLTFSIFFEQGGTLDTVMMLLGQKDHIQLWIANPRLSNWMMALVTLWKYVGYSFVVYIGVMQSVPADLYEAAGIDGANGFIKFTAITLPHIKMMVGLMTLSSIIGSFSVFEIPFIMTAGANGTNTFVITTVNSAFKYSQYGLACALAVVLLVIISIIVIAQRKLTREA